MCNDPWSLHRFLQLVVVSLTLWCYQLSGKLKNYPHPFYGIYQKVIKQLILTQLGYIFTIWAESIWQQVLLIFPQNTVMFSSNSCTLYLSKCIAQYLVQVEEIWILSDKDFAITGWTQCQNINSYNAHTMSICNKLFSFSIHVEGGKICLGKNQTMKQLTHILHCTMLHKIHVIENTLHYSILLV